MELGRIEERINDIRLNIHQPDGQVLRLGHHGPSIDWHIHHPHTLHAIIRQPGLNLGRSYVNGEWDIDSIHLSDLITTLVPGQSSPGLLDGRPCLRRLRARLPQLRKRSTRSHWQDFSPWLSRVCLGEALFHNCARYSEAGTTTEQAQRLTAQQLAERLQLNHDHHLLDLNAGWGALPLFLAEHFGVRITAMVSSREQLQYAHGEARRHGLDSQIHYRLGSFHQCRGRFDRILASGFLEQFTESAYPAIFEHIEHLLHEDGFAWLQVTGRSHTSGLSNQWHQRQLPARHSIPLLSDICTAIEQSQLRQLQTEDYSTHWQQDLRTRARRYHRHRAAISRRFGTTRTRHWEFLLASEISAARRGQLRQYDVLLGQARCHWPVNDLRQSPSEYQLPETIARQIPGLVTLRSN
jgi:cyclopropane-fatty-acyl-phospholipid synthase